MNCLECINYVEDKFEVSKWHVNNIDIWPWMRMAILDENTAYAVVSSEIVRDTLISRLKSNMTVLFDFLRASVMDYNHSEHARMVDAVFLG